MKRSLCLGLLSVVASVTASAQSLYSVASPVGLEESLPLSFRTSLSFGYDDNVNAVSKSSYGYQDSAFSRFSVSAIMANWDARTQYSFDCQLGGIFYFENMRFGTKDVMSDITFKGSLVHNFDSTLRYNASAGISYMPEPDYSSGVMVGNRAGEYIHAYFDNSISKAWDSRFSTTSGFNLATLHYTDSYSKIDNREYIRLLQSFRYKWDSRSAVSLSWRGEYADRRYGRDALSNFIYAGYEYALTKHTNVTANVGPQLKHTNGIGTHNSIFISGGLNHRLTDHASLGIFIRREDESTNTYQRERSYGSNQTYRLGMTGSYKLNHVFTLDGGVNWVYCMYRKGESGLENKNTSTYNLGVGISYQIRPDLSCRFGYSYTHGKNGGLGNFINSKYVRNIYTLSANYNF